MVIHERILGALQKELQNKYLVSSSIRHKGERGRSREHGVSSFLRENLPTAYGVATGELFSFYADGISPQCDVIVYDELRSPIFGRGAAVQRVPIEGALAVVEVRSVIDSAALRDTSRKIKRLFHRPRPSPPCPPAALSLVRSPWASPYPPAPPGARPRRTGA